MYFIRIRHIHLKEKNHDSSNIILHHQWVWLIKMHKLHNRGASSLVANKHFIEIVAQQKLNLHEKS